MDLKDFRTIEDAVDYMQLEYAPAELPGLLTMFATKCAEIGAERMQDACANGIVKNGLTSKALFIVRQLSPSEVIKG